MWFSNIFEKVDFLDPGLPWAKKSTFFKISENHIKTHNIGKSYVKNTILIVLEVIFNVKTRDLATSRYWKTLFLVIVTRFPAKIANDVMFGQIKSCYWHWELSTYIHIFFKIDQHVRLTTVRKVKISRFFVETRDFRSKNRVFRLWFTYIMWFYVIFRDFEKSRFSRPMGPYRQKNRFFWKSSKIT